MMHPGEVIQQVAPRGRIYLPNASYAEVRNAILNGVDLKPNLTGVVATGGRLNLVGMC